MVALEWQAIKEARDSGVPVVAVANPGSGPGNDADRPSYELGMQALRDSGVEARGADLEFRFTCTRRRETRDGGWGGDRS